MRADPVKQFLSGATGDRRRLALIELYRGPLRQISLELKKQYLGLPLPLSEKHKATAEQNFRLHAEMAYGYKGIASNIEPAAAHRPCLQAGASARPERSLPSAGAAHRPHLPLSRPLGGQGRHCAVRRV